MKAILITQLYSNYIKPFIAEVLVLFAFVFLLNNYIGNAQTHINGDGVGYYEYLPSTFIHNDMVRCNTPITTDSLVYSRINTKDVYVDYGDFEVNKYPCGTAVLQLPFFLYTYCTTPLDNTYNDGYHAPFQKSVFYAALFYAFLTLLFFKKLLRLYSIQPWVIVLMQVLLILATSLTNYLNFDASFSHIYSLFAITAFAYYATAYFTNNNPNYIIGAAIFLALIIILRQVNGIIIFSLPFLAGSFASFKTGVIALFAHKRKLLVALCIGLAIISIQCVFWYVQTGSFIVYSYPGEGFNFDNPQLFNILFSYKKGLFVYTPVLFLSLLSVVWFIATKRYYFAVSWLIFFFVVTYMLSSWWSWFYGCSYGLRAYIDYYTLLFIPLAVMLCTTKKAWAIPIATVGLLTIPINVIQTYQYKEYILDWSNMNENNYWKVFLKTNDKYKGLIWNQKSNNNDYTLHKEIQLGNILIGKSNTEIIYTAPTDSIPNFNTVTDIQLQFDNHFYEQSQVQFTVHVHDASTTYCWHERSLLHFHQTNFNEWQTGMFNFKFAPIATPTIKTVTIAVKTNDYDNLNTTVVRFLSHK